MALCFHFGLLRPGHSLFQGVFLVVLKQLVWLDLFQRHEWFLPRLVLVDVVVDELDSLKAHVVKVDEETEGRGLLLVLLRLLVALIGSRGDLFQLGYAGDFPVAAAAHVKPLIQIRACVYIEPLLGVLILAQNKHLAASSVRDEERVQGFKVDKAEARLIVDLESVLRVNGALL